MSNYETGYDYVPGEGVWYLNEPAQTIHHGIVVQVDIKIYPDNAYLPPTPTIVYGVTPTPSPNVPNIDHLVYWIILDSNVGSIKALPQDVFATMTAALAALTILINPNVTPTPTPTVTSTFTPTVTVTTTPTPTPTNTPTPSR
jgi:hypothetical protein